MSRDSMKKSNNLRSSVAAEAPMASASFRSSSGKSKLLVNAANLNLPLSVVQLIHMYTYAIDYTF